MTTHAHFLRQLLVVLRLQHLKWAVPFEELRDYLLEQTSLRDLAASYSQRTLQRDWPQIAERFGVTIEHDRRAGGYLIVSADPLPEGYQRLLDAFELQEFLRLPTALSPFVQWESRRPLGTEWLQPLLRAVRLRRQVSFQYHKFWEEAPTIGQFRPCCLKNSKAGGTCWRTSRPGRGCGASGWTVSGRWNRLLFHLSPLQILSLLLTTPTALVLFARTTSRRQGLFWRWNQRRDSTSNYFPSIPRSEYWWI